LKLLELFWSKNYRICRNIFDFIWSRSIGYDSFKMFRLNCVPRFLNLLNNNISGPDEHPIACTTTASNLISMIWWRQAKHNISLYIFFSSRIHGPISQSSINCSSVKAHTFNLLTKSPRWCSLIYCQRYWLPRSGY